MAPSPGRPPRTTLLLRFSEKVGLSFWGPTVTPPSTLLSVSISITRVLGTELCMGPPASQVLGIDTLHVSSAVSELANFMNRSCFFQRKERRHGESKDGPGKSLEIWVWRDESWSVH